MPGDCPCLCAARWHETRARIHPSRDAEMGLHTLPRCDSGLDHRTNIKVAFTQSTKVLPTIDSWYIRRERGPKMRSSEILRKTIQGLPRGFRVVFVLRDVENLSTEETAEALGL